MHLLRSDGKTCCLIESADEKKVELKDDEIYFMPNASYWEDDTRNEMMIVWKVLTAELETTWNGQY